MYHLLRHYLLYSPQHSWGFSVFNYKFRRYVLPTPGIFDGKFASAIHANALKFQNSIIHNPSKFEQFISAFPTTAAPRFPNLPERRRSPPCLVRLWLIGDMSSISFYAFASKLFCGFSTPTASSPASGMPLLAFPHASLYIMHISVCLAASALVVYIVHPLLE